jgi:outer membrane protein assembly factor BamB
MRIPGSFPRTASIWGCLLLLAAVWEGFAAPAEARWPQFRGRGGSGIGEGILPETFGPGTNEVWAVETPPGHSSPVIWGQRIFLTAFVEGRLRTLGLDARDGKVLWQRDVEPGAIERGSHNSHPAASTPAVDAQRVYAYFGSFGVAAFDHQGKELWRAPLPTPVTQHGASSSPVVAGGLVILARDQDVGSHLIALDSRTGREVWRVDRAAFRRSFSTPLLWPPARPDTVILPGTLRLVAYALRDGSERWSVSGLPNETVASAVGAEGMIYFAGWTSGSGVRAMPGFEAQLAAGDRDGDGRLSRDEAPNGPARQHFPYIDADKDGQINRREWEELSHIFDASQNVALAVRPGGRGDVTATHVAWRQARGLPYVPSVLVHEGRVYLVKNGGLVTCMRARTGEVLFQEERLGALGDYYASPVASGDKVLMVSQPGVAVVLRVADTLEVLARNPMGETVMATPALVGGRIYIRTAGHLRVFARPGAGDGR